MDDMETQMLVLETPYFIFGIEGSEYILWESIFCEMDGNTKKLNLWKGGGCHGRQTKETALGSPSCGPHCHYNVGPSLLQGVQVGYLHCARLFWKC